MRLFHTALAAMLLLLAVAGCGTLPDVSRFSDATTQLYVTVQTSGNSAVAELAAVQRAQSPSAGTDNSAKVAKGWASAAKAAKAVADYSDSLRALVEAGDQGKASAQKVVQSVDALVKTAAGAYPGGQEGAAVVQGVFDGLASLYGAAARELAAQKLATEIQNADPTIQTLAAGLSKQFVGLAQILRSSKNVLLFEVEDQPKFKKPKEFLNLYDGARTNLLAEVVGTGVVTTNASLLERWQWADKMVQAERQQPWYQDYMAARAGIEARLDAEIAVAEKASGVINAWAASHKDLVTAVKQKRSPNFAVLTALAQDLMETYAQTKTKVEQARSNTTNK